MNPWRITHRYDAAYRRKHLRDGDCQRFDGPCDNPEHLRTNAESLLTALQRNQRRSARFWLVVCAVLFAAAAWIGVVFALENLPAMAERLSHFFH